MNKARRYRIRVVGIGASTGGPPVLEAILSRLPAEFPAPILVVQHIAEGFVGGLVDCLQRVSALRVGLAIAGERAAPGHVYLAPDGVHLGIKEDATLVLDDSPAERSQRPAVSFLFRSIASSYGDAAAAALLTGMGCDGAAELRVLRELNAVTIAQSERSCTVFGMPGEAIRLGAARYVLAPEEVAELLCSFGGVAALPPPRASARRSAAGERTCDAAKAR